MSNQIVESRKNDVQAETLQVVRPLVDPDKAVRDFEEFQQLKSKLLSKDDYQSIQGKNFIKKSGWRKLALVFNVSDSIVEEKKDARDDKSFVWTFKVRATAPNGRYSEAVGSCDSSERKFSKLEHDVRATAHTRAKSRAISDLIGAGEVSAEELEDEDPSPKSEPRNITPPPGPPRIPSEEDMIALVATLPWEEQKDGSEIALVEDDGKILKEAQPLIDAIKLANGKYLLSDYAYYWKSVSRKILRKKAANQA
jgi:hypothetical protein